MQTSGVNSINSNTCYRADSGLKKQTAPSFEGMLIMPTRQEIRRHLANREDAKTLIKALRKLKAKVADLFDNVKVQLGEGNQFSISQAVPEILYPVTVSGKAGEAGQVVEKFIKGVTQIPTNFIKKFNFESKILSKPPKKELKGPLQALLERFELSNLEKPEPRPLEELKLDELGGLEPADPRFTRKLRDFRELEPPLIKKDLFPPKENLNGHPVTTPIEIDPQLLELLESLKKRPKGSEG